MKKKDEIKVCLVGSSGGHLTHLYMLKPFWKDKNRFWVTFDKEDARSLLEGEKVYPCYFPTNRSIKALIKNTKIAWDVLHYDLRQSQSVLRQWHQANRLLRRENIPLPDLSGQLENVQQSGNEIAKRGMPT